MHAASDLQRAVEAFWVTHSLPKGVAVLVGLSGGGDSVALLHLLRHIAPRFSLQLRAAHLDHGIRAESVQDAAFVRRLCEALQVPLTVERLDVPALARQRGQGLEETGREVRRAFLRRTAAKTNCPLIALGHHRGDQAETLLMRLLRGSGLTGLAAMRPHSPPFIRPLLEFSRQNLEAYLVFAGQDFLRDASNDDLGYTRNRIRHRLLPQLAAFNPRVEEHLARFSRRIALEEDFWQQQVERSLATLRCCEGDDFWLERPALLELHPALRARVLRQALADVRGGLQGLAAVHVDALEDLLAGKAPQGEVHLPQGWAGRRYERLWLRRTPPPLPQPFAVEVAGPGRVALPDGRRLLFSIEATPRGEGPCAVEFPAAAVPFPLTVRSLRPGDRFHPRGAPGSRKLKDYLIDGKVPRERRLRLPVLEGRQILWLAGMARCQQWLCETGCEAVLRVVLEEDRGLE